MASVAVVAKRRAEAEGAVAKVVASLAEKFGVEVTTNNLPIRDQEMKRVLQFESLADILQKIDAAAEEKSKTSKTETVEFVEEEVEIVEPKPKRSSGKGKGK